MQVVLTGFNEILFCFIQSKTVCRYGCTYFLAAPVLVCEDVMSICVGHYLNRCIRWW